MLKRIANFIGKDYTNSVRNNMVIYMILFPVLLALGLKLFMPSATEMEVTIAVEQGVEQRVINELKKYGDVELFADRQQVAERVKRLDDISGIIKENDEYVILLEGNEPEDTAVMARAVMNQVLSARSDVEFKHKTLGKTNNMMNEISGSLLLLTAVMIGGLISGLNIIEEKETEAINSLSVSPLKLRDFIIAHSVIATLVSILLAVLAGLIFSGTGINYWLVLVAMVCTTGFGLAWGMLIGGISDNLISAIAVIKSTALFVVGIPIASVYVPSAWRWVLYPFPNYWAFQAYRNIFNGGQQWISFNSSCIITLVISLFLLLALTPVLRKRFNIR